MTAGERLELSELSTRLFGLDGQGGSLGRIESKLDVLDGRTSALERDRIAREAVSAAGDRLDTERQSGNRWRASYMVALAGTAVGVLGWLLSAAGWVGK